MAIEYRVWREDGDLVSVHRKRETAERAAEKARAACPCGTDGQEENPGRGDFRCGVLNPHGISIQVCRDGYDVTGDPTL